MTLNGSIRGYTARIDLSDGVQSWDSCRNPPHFAFFWKRSSLPSFLSLPTLIRLVPQINAQDRYVSHEESTDYISYFDWTPVSHCHYAKPSNQYSRPHEASIARTGFEVWMKADYWTAVKLRRLLWQRGLGGRGEGSGIEMVFYLLSSKGIHWTSYGDELNPFSIVLWDGEQ